jgi:hypothetical protein
VLTLIRRKKQKFARAAGSWGLQVFLPLATPNCSRIESTRCGLRDLVATGWIEIDAYIGRTGSFQSTGAVIVCQRDRAASICYSGWFLISQFIFFDAVSELLPLLGCLFQCLFA